MAAGATAGNRQILTTCKIFVVEASTPEAAKKQAQARRAAAIRKAEREAAKKLQGKSHPTTG